jgi:hypothetical protein
MCHIFSYCSFSHLFSKKRSSPNISNRTVILDTLLDKKDCKLYQSWLPKLRSSHSYGMSRYGRGRNGNVIMSNSVLWQIFSISSLCQASLYSTTPSICCHLYNYKVYLNFLLWSISSKCYTLIILSCWFSLSLSLFLSHSLNSLFLPSCHWAYSYSKVYKIYWKYNARFATSITLHPLHQI